MIKKNLNIFIILTIINFFGFSNNYSRFKKDGLYGLITKDRTIVMQPSYGWIIVNSNSIIGFRRRNSENRLYSQRTKIIKCDKRKLKKL